MAADQARGSEWGGRWGPCSASHAVAGATSCEAEQGPQRQRVLLPPGHPARSRNGRSVSHNISGVRGPKNGVHLTWQSYAFALVNSPHLKNLTHLQLRLTDIGDAGCEDIVKSGILRRLNWFDLRHGCISDDGARLLAECPDLKNLQHLDVSRNALTAEGVKLLRNVVPSVAADYQQTSEEVSTREYLYEGDIE